MPQGRDPAPGGKLLGGAGSGKATKCQETCQERGAASAVTPSICPSLPATCSCGSAGLGPGGADELEAARPRSRVPGAVRRLRALSPKRLGFTERHQNSRVCAGPLTACQVFEWAGVAGCWSRLLSFEPTPGKGGREQLRGGGESAEEPPPSSCPHLWLWGRGQRSPRPAPPARRCPDLVWGSLGC